MVRYFGQTTDVRIFNPGSAPPNQFVTLCLLDVCCQFATLSRILIIWATPAEPDLARLLPAFISVLSPKYHVFCCDQNGPAARREEGAYLNRYVTDEQRRRRPIFIATLRAGASWLFFRVARSTRMTQIWVLYRQSGSDRLEKHPTDLRQNTCYFGDRTRARKIHTATNHPIEK